ncbi:MULTISPECIES: universal stress protein [Rhodobacterales]|jgi:nucleotide-binding universal stress UspA family protein|uniref:Universal stress protein n=1 Tax=Phaeobacter gallaeciensis TaxID=60890 RepID=A0A1B0ZN32_9RHOB|nr:MULTISPECIES: universal stress protein [Phaeobacter]MDF1773920.1 universal stress protein [Pseudophaeobacter sp. bin_em_oilr2.035]MEC9311460.1 universal stress protein [Pseudomonadota bacterium]ANP35521.1 universal stress protein [Phaeobacter gallaeciensis]MDE4063479.1 universal stress protein [Phaeobacter gallaeciensis]MDE4098634.1 universal stress protein [Phaeobacter gallaeciensis]
MYHNILVPISFDPDRDVSAPLKLARLLATPEAKITLLHVVEQIPSYAITYMPADYMAEARAALESELSALADTLPNAKGLVIEGHSGRSILDWAEQNNPDLIIIASHRPGMQDLLLGSTAAQVVRHAGCAVHVVR